MRGNKPKWEKKEKGRENSQYKIIFTQINIRSSTKKKQKKIYRRKRQLQENISSRTLHTHTKYQNEGTEKKKNGKVEKAKKNGKRYQKHRGRRMEDVNGGVDRRFRDVLVRGWVLGIRVGCCGGSFLTFSGVLFGLWGV